MKTNKGNSAKRKSNIEILVAQYGLYGVIIAAVIGACGVVAAAFLGYLGIRAQISVPMNASQTAEARFLLTPSPSQTLTPTSTSTSTSIPLPTPTQRIAVVTPAVLDSSDVVFPAPTIGAQLNFSPKETINTDVFKRSPFNGIFMSETSIERIAPSWFAIYPDGTSIKAESDTCLINMGASSPYASSGPLNIKTSRISFYFAIYADYRYSYEVQDIEILIADFVPMDNNIVELEIGLPGAGGMGFPFKDVRAMKTWVDGISNTVYKMDFKDFVLGPNNGVNVTVPIAMIDAGNYQFIVKVNGVATPTYAGDPAGKLSLTSNVLEYIWVRVSDPRDYTIAEFKDVFGNKIDVDLQPCP